VITPFLRSISQFREALGRFTLGEPVRAIARGTRVDWKTEAK
jgi:hypothetical protein